MKNIPIKPNVSITKLKTLFSIISQILQLNYLIFFKFLSLSGMIIF